MPAPMATSLRLVSRLRWSPTRPPSCQITGTTRIRSGSHTVRETVRGSTTTYRLAIVTGKGLEFPQVAGTNQDYGTDGGVHNFLRYLEGWGSATHYYLGSLVSFYYDQQAVGPFKCCNTVYGPPARKFDFDTNFLQPLLLPPRTPMLRDVNTIGFTEVISPTQ